jgi:hypothetical protein
MAHESQVLTAPTAETIRLIELHHQLVALHSLQPAYEADTFSLAQPSPFRFVPMVASNGAGKLIQGE